MGKPLTRWHKAGRFVTGIVVLCFFLPFFGVSCGPVDIISVSGTDMVGGCKPGGIISEAKNERGGGGGGDLDIKIDNVDREPLAIIAMALVVIAAGLAWIRTRQALIASFVVALAALGAMGGLYLKVTGDLNDGVETELAKKKIEDNPMSRDMAKDIDSGSRFGFWLAAIGLVTSATLAGMALRDRNGISTPGPTPGPRPTPT